MIIRKASREDAPAIAACLLLAMEEIVYRFMGRRDRERANAFLLRFVETENNQYSYQNCWVAAIGEKVVAAVNVYDGGQLHRLRQPVLHYIHHQLGNNLLPEDETGAGEQYIDSFGVLPQHQGKGIGASLLQFLIDRYVKQKAQTLGLLVDKDNPQAKRLYRRLGFGPVGTKKLLDKTMEHLQIHPAGTAS